MIEKHQQANGIGRGKITINPEYIRRAGEITVGGLPIKVLSSNPNTGRVLAQFPDGHTEEVKAAPDYFIGGNTSTKELKNNLPIYGETNTAANERADSLDEAHDLTPIFSNLITAGQISTMNEGALDLLNGKYLEGTTKLLSPAMFGSGIGGIVARSGIGGYNLFNKNGVRKTYNLFNLGHYGEGALSLLGDAFNAAMAAEGLGSISNTLKGTSGYKNWRLAREINKSIKEAAPKIKLPINTEIDVRQFKTLQSKEPLTSLKFFESPQSKISLAERAGVPKGERNFKPKWHVANYPGYLLKGLMKGSLLERLLSKNGTININQLNAYFNKASLIEREVANKVLAEKFSGLKTIDYNLFKKAVLDELINYSTKPQIKYSTYGMDRLGFNTIREPDGAGGIIEYIPRIRTNTFTFESPRIPIGNNKHYDLTTLGHSRTYTTPQEPKVLHVLESQSDWGQSHVKMMPSVLAHQIAVEKALKSGNTNAFHSFTNRLGSLLANKLTKYERMALENINKEIESGLPSGFLTIEDLWNKKYEILKKAGNRSNIGVLGLHLHDNYLQRQLQENLRYAAENGLTKMRYPTSETAAKIEGYAKQNLYKNQEGKIVTSREALQHSDPNITNDLREDLAELASNLRQQGIQPSTNLLWIRMNAQLKELESPKLKEGFLDIGLDYPLEHQTILKKYTDFPKLFLKLYKGYNVRTVTDVKGNTWYEVDVPKGYLSREWLFKQGGKMNILEFLKNGSGIYIKPENKGKFTKYCHGKVTSECIARGKRSSDPTVRKRATFALNVRRWKHEEGGKAFINGVNVLDSNPTAYKYVKKKYKMALEGTKLTFGLKVSNVGNWINNNLDIVNTAVNGITGFISANKKSRVADQFAKAKEAEMKSFKEKTWKEKYMENLLAQEDRSDVVNMSRAYNQTSGDVAQAVQEKLLKIDSQIAAAQLKAAQARGNAWGGILKGAGEIAMNALASNGIPKSKTSPTSLTGLKTSSFGGINTPQFTSPQTNYSFLK